MIDDSFTYTCGREPSSRSTAVERDAVGRRVEGRERRDVIEDDAKRRDLIGDADDRLEKRQAGVGRVHHEVGVGQALQPVDERRHFDLSREVATPEIPATDAAEERILCVAPEILGKLRLLRLEIADGPDDDGILLCHLQDPQVVLYPGARLDFDRADCAERTSERPIARRKRWHRRSGVLGTTIRCPLRAGRIEQVNVGIDDRDRWQLVGSNTGRNGGSSNTGEKRSAFHQ